MWTKVLLLLASSPLITSFLLDGASLKIGSFNVKWFTVSKSTDHTVLDIVAKIINRYDVMLMMEIRDDAQQTAVNRLWTVVNKTQPYGLSISHKVGRTTYKEQYAFFYRISTVSISKEFQYDDSPNDEFDREPFSVLVAPESENMKPLALIGSHIKPLDANNELAKVPDVILNVQSALNTQRVVFMGDLNADCRYMSHTKLEHLQLRTDDAYTWLIPDTADTTVSTTTDCAYDRMILTKGVKSEKAEVFYFDKAYGLTNDEAMKVSDHFPIEATLH